MSEVCEIAKALWGMYFSSKCQGGIEKVLPFFDDACVIIGTGKHELYQSKQELFGALLEEETKGMFADFEILNEWYEEQKINEELSMVYGELHVLHRQEGCEDANVEMKTRFSALFHKRESGWTLMHLHHSMPYLEQQDGEYYPKMLSEKLKETKELAEQMRLLARHDPLTHLFNRTAFFEEGEQRLRSYKHCYCMIIDLDHFKLINDTYGHIKGDEVLKKAGEILQKSIRKEDIASRMGGDEFALFCTDVLSEEIVCKIAQRILDCYHKEMSILLDMDTGVSIGITKVAPDDTMMDAYRKADFALYQTKRKGRNGYTLYELQTEHD